MSVIEPSIDQLLDRTDNDKFLLCSVASKRARDINDMMRGQRDRAIAASFTTEIARLAGRKPLSFAMEEIERGEIGFDSESFKGEQL